MGKPTTRVGNASNVAGAPPSWLPAVMKAGQFVAAKMHAGCQRRCRRDTGQYASVGLNTMTSAARASASQSEPSSATAIPSGIA